MMGLLNLDVVVIAQKFRRFGGQFEQHEDRQRHVGRLEDGDVARSLLDRGMIRILQTCGAYEHGDARSRHVLSQWRVEAGTVKSMRTLGVSSDQT